MVSSNCGGALELGLVNLGLSFLRADVPPNLQSGFTRQSHADMGGVKATPR